MLLVRGTKLGLSAVVIKKIIISLATQCSLWDSGNGFAREHVRNAEP